jgi:hypothetical protein
MKHCYSFIIWVQQEYVSVTTLLSTS